jgi:hypothetical protein
MIQDFVWQLSLSGRPFINTVNVNKTKPMFLSTHWPPGTKVVTRPRAKGATGAAASSAPRQENSLHNNAHTLCRYNPSSIYLMCLAQGTVSQDTLSLFCLSHMTALLALISRSSRGMHRGLRDPSSDVHHIHITPVDYQTPSQNLHQPKSRIHVCSVKQVGFNLVNANDCQP